MAQDEEYESTTPIGISAGDPEGWDGLERNVAGGLLPDKEGGSKCGAGACCKAHGAILFETCNRVSANPCVRKVESTWRLMMGDREASGNNPKKQNNGAREIAMCGLRSNMYLESIKESKCQDKECYRRGLGCAFDGVSCRMRHVHMAATLSQV